MTRTGWASSTTTTTTAASTWATRARNTRARSCRRGAPTSCSRSRSTPTSTCWCTGSGCGSSTRAVHETPAAQELDRDYRGLRRDRRLDRARDRGGEPARRDQGAQGGRLMVPALVQLINLTRDPGAGDFFFVLVWAVCTLLLAAFYCYRMFQRQLFQHLWSSCIQPRSKARPDAARVSGWRPGSRWCPAWASCTTVNRRRPWSSSSVWSCSSW